MQAAHRQSLCEGCAEAVEEPEFLFAAGMRQFARRSIRDHVKVAQFTGGPALIDPRRAASIPCRYFVSLHFMALSVGHASPLRLRPPEPQRVRSRTRKSRPAYRPIKSANFPAFSSWDFHFLLA
jgi:hypothetical protein